MQTENESDKQHWTSVTNSTCVSDHCPLAGWCSCMYGNQTRHRLSTNSRVCMCACTHTRTHARTHARTHTHTHTHTLQHNTHTLQHNTHTHCSTMHTHTAHTLQHNTHTHTHTLQHNAHTHCSTTHTHTHTTAQHTHCSTTHTHTAAQYTHNTAQHPPTHTHTHTHTYVYLWFATVVICGQVPGVLCAEGQQISPGQHPPDRQGTRGIQVQCCQKMEHSSCCQRVSYHHEYLKRFIEGRSRPKTASKRWWCVSIYNTLFNRGEVRAVLSATQWCHHLQERLL